MLFLKTKIKGLSGVEIIERILSYQPIRNYTLPELKSIAYGKYGKYMMETYIPASIRKLRNPKYGGYTISTSRRKKDKLWYYRMEI